MNKSNTLLSLGVLIKRNVKLFLKDKMTVFFSVLAPVIVLLIYILFLGELQVGSIQQILESEGIGSDIVSIQDVRGIVNNWMIAGVMGVSCITVALNANIMMVRDRAYGNINDVLSSPVKRWVLYASYIISCFIVTLSIALVVLVVSLCYLAGSGGFMISWKDFFAILGITILSTISSSCFTALVCGFIKSTSALAAANGIFATAIGFLIGAYLPFGMLPKAIGWIGCFIPGTYSVGLFKEYFLNGMFTNITSKLPADKVAEFMDKLSGQYSIKLEMFGQEITTGWMVLALLISIALFASLILIFYTNKKTNFFAVGKKVNKKKIKSSVVVECQPCKVEDASESKQENDESACEIKKEIKNKS